MDTRCLVLVCELERGCSTKPTAYRAFIIISGLAVVLIGLLLLAPTPASDKFNSTFDPHTFPERALPMLLGSDVHHIFAEDEWGDYLIFNLYPRKKVFVDGRSDFYGDDFGERYLDVLNVQWNWQKILDQIRD